jgi:signal transduction histidine kinase
VYLLAPKAEFATWTLSGSGVVDVDLGNLRVRLHGIQDGGVRAGVGDLGMQDGVRAVAHTHLHPQPHPRTCMTPAPIPAEPLRLYDLLHPEDHAMVLAAWQQAVAARALFATECRICLPGQAKRLLAVRGAPQVDRRGRVRRWVGTCEDVTALRQHMHEQARVFALSHAEAGRLRHDLSTRLERERSTRAELIQARDQLKALQALTDTALFHLDLEALLPAVLHRVRKTLAVDDVAILLVTADGQALEGWLAVGVEKAIIRQERVRIGEGFAGRIALTRQPVVVEDLTTYPVVNPVLHTLRSALGIPLLAGKRLLGVLYVGTQTHRVFTAGDVSLLQQAGERLALAIDRANAYAATQAAQAEAERQAEQLDRIIEQMGEGLAVYDAHGQLLRTNAAYRRILGLEDAPAVRDFFALPLHERTGRFQPRDRQGVTLAMEDWPLMRALRGAGGGEVATGELQLCGLDGREHTLLVSAAPLREHNGHVVGVVSVARDQTEFNQLAREREQAQAREWAALEVAHQLDQFFAMAAHDIRTPIAAVHMGVELAQWQAERLRAVLAGPEPEREVGASPGAGPAAVAKQTQQIKVAALTERMVASLAAARENADRLTNLTRVLFDVAKARSGRLEVQLAPCDLKVMVREQVVVQRLAAPQRRIRLDLPKRAASVLVQGDCDRLGQVLMNYLSNALKYSANDQPVAVRLTVADGWAVVAVRDHGPGLAPEEQEKVWGLLHRAPGVAIMGSAGDASGAGTGSMGIGLYICKSLIELHHGRVGVESTVHQGSTFWFALPLAADALLDSHVDAAGNHLQEAHILDAHRDDAANARISATPLRTP